MKKIYFLFVALLTFVAAPAQYTINFDSFTPGDVSTQATTHTILWPVATATDPQVTTAQAHSAPHSMMIRPNGAGIADDILFQLGNKTTGTWVVEWWMYVPTGNNGYFNIQEHENATPNQWNGEFYVDQSTAGGSPGVITHDQTSSTAPYPNDVWFEIVITVDIDNDLISVTVDGNSLLQNAVYQDTTGLPANQLGAADFYSSDSNTTFYVDDFFFHEICYPASVPTLVAFTDTTADVSWTASSNETNGYSWVLMANGDDPATGTPLQSGTTPTGITTVNLTGLIANTQYDFYLQADCAAKGTSVYVLLEFTTKLACNLSGVVSTFPFMEDFESSSPTIGCLEQIQVAGAANWTFAQGSSGGVVTTAYSGAQNARFVSENSTASPVTKLVAPPMDLTLLANPELSFYYAQESWFGDTNELKVYYRISATGQWVELAHYTNNVDVWTQAVIPLPNPTATYQIAFEGINNFGHANVLDDISVGEGLSVRSTNFENFSFYPNPVGSELFLNSNRTVKKVVVYDLAGKELIVNSKNRIDKINMIALPTGIYFMEVFIGDGRRVFKLLKK